MSVTAPPPTSSTMLPPAPPTTTTITIQQLQDQINDMAQKLEKTMTELSKLKKLKKKEIKAKKKDDKSPKKAKSAYVFFCKETAVLLNTQNFPSKGRFVEFARLWRIAKANKETGVYDELAAADKQRFMKEKEAVMYPPVDNSDNDTKIETDE